LKLMPRSLFGRSAMTIALTLLVFMTFSMSAAVYFIAIPMAERSADDFAAVIVSAAHTMQNLPHEMHEQFQHQLLLDHGLIVTEETPALAKKTFDVPYYVFFQESLARRAGRELAISESEKGPLIWVDIPTDHRTIRMGFNRERLGTNPPVVLLLAIGVGALLTLLTSLMEVRRVVRPLADMSVAVQEVGRGHSPPALSEDGPEEIAALARAFNRILTRLGLAVEMLNEDSQPDLIADIRRDLAAMKSLIGQFLQFSQGLERSNPIELDLEDFLEEQAADLRRDGVEVQVSGCGPCPFVADPVALERVLANLMENAGHHGGGEPVDVNLRCDEASVSIEICDRGPGIPADQAEAVFQPFHRLETARSSKTGGSGLGLAIARQLANKHGWTIELLPRKDGGTVANVVLPKTL